MKTRRLATAVESGRVSSSLAQALGFVSKMIVKREDAGSVMRLKVLGQLI